MKEFLPNPITNEKRRLNVLKNLNFFYYNSIRVVFWLARNEEATNEMKVRVATATRVWPRCRDVASVDVKVVVIDNILFWI